MLKKLTGDPRIELGLLDPESYVVKIKQYFIDRLGLFCSGIHPSTRPYRYIKDMMLQEVSAIWSTPLDVATPLYGAGSLTGDNYITGMLD